MQLPTNMASTPKKLDALAPVVVNPDDILHVFKCRQRYMTYIFQNGMKAEFIDFKFYTKRPSQIEELNAEISYGHPMIYVDENEKEIVAEDRDPMVALRKKIRAEMIAEGFRKVDPSNDMGNYEPGKLNPTSTTDIASTALGNGPSGESTGAKLAALTASLAAKVK